MPNKFMITFGQIHPLKDCWIEVIADTENEARAKVFECIGKHWAFIYTEAEFEALYFQGGKVGRTIE